MRHDKTYTDDLDYLAQQGFEKIPVSEKELEGLKKKVRAKAFSYNSGFYFGFISLLTGIFIGASLFFALSEETAEVLPGDHQPVIKDTVSAAVSEVLPPVKHDTLVIAKENFVNPYAKPVAANDQPAETMQPQQADSVTSIPEKPISSSLFNRGKVEEGKLKFIANAPVLYIHDLKVTNYTLLYFRKNRFVRFDEKLGLTADYASNADMEKGTIRTRQNADYFLHEELAQALLYFKKGKYDQCIATLNIVSTYNDDDLNCDFYIAMCYYYKRNYEKAIGLFDKCIINLNNTFLQEAMYYKAAALYDSDNKPGAITLFKEIVEEDGFYAEKAKAYLLQ